MDMVSPTGIELRQAKERIQFLENELRRFTRGAEYKPENVKEEKRIQNPKEGIQEDDIGKLQKRNRELIERIVYLEKAQETSLNNKNNNAKPNLSDDQNTIEVLEKERNIYKVILISFFFIPNV